MLALVLLSVGLLGLASSGLFVSGMLNRGRRVAAAATFAGRRLEQLRAVACAPGRRSDGSERLARGGVALATNTWWFEDQGRGLIRIRVASRYVTSPHRLRTDTFETAVTCR